MTRKNKNSRQKSFFFEDYIESEIIENNTSKEVKVSLNRVAFLFFIFFSLIVIFSLKIIYLSLFPEKKYFSFNNDSSFYKERRDIVDRNKNIIATNVNVYKVGIRPQFIINKEKFLINLRLKFPNLDSDNIKEKLKKGKFFYLDKKRITEEEKDKFWSLGLNNKAIDIQEIQARIYPHKNLFSHILGQIDDDNIGISGVEKFFDKNLLATELRSSPLVLTLDLNLQYLIREELIRAKENFNSVGAAALLMNVDSGEILSLISLPDYDLNQRTSINNEAYLNKITLGVYELGSVFKTFTVAAGLEHNVINSSTVFNNLENSITCDKYTISEHDKLPEDLSVEQILIRSSNIGSVRIAQQIGVKKYEDFLNSLELFNKISFDLEEIGTPIPFKWGKCKLATASYGHGITTTPLQLAKAYAILGNGGYKIKPFILKKDKKLIQKGEKIISTSTSNKINLILRKVVNTKEGTAKFANIEGYEIGGKTGTALKYNSSAKLNTFVSLFPASKPKYVLFVMLDEPKPAPNYVYEFPPSEKFPKGYKHKGEKRNTSGWNTVVVAGKIIERIGPILAINNLQASNKF